jgi:hypothetical protein
VFSGNVTPDEMLKLIERKGGDERKMALSEGYFYLAQYYLGQGDKAKARKYLQESRRQNVIIYTEHAAAAFELKRLGSPTETGSLPAPETAKETGNLRVAPSGEKKSSRKAPRKANEPWNSNLWRQ